MRLLEVPEGSEVPGSSWRFLMVSGGSRRFLEVPGGSWRFLEVPGGSWRFLEVPGGSLDVFIYVLRTEKIAFLTNKSFVLFFN